MNRTATTETDIPQSGVILVTGPARSGKSEWAEAVAVASGLSVTYLATARRDPSDPDWEARLLAHAARRPSAWQTQEVPMALPEAVAENCDRPVAGCLLVDSLGTWAANLLEREEPHWQECIDTLLQNLQKRQQQPETLTILVAEETGWSVVPAYPAGRKFRDRLGSLTRQIAAYADRTYLIAGGHALNLSKLGVPLPQKLEKP